MSTLAARLSPLAWQQKGKLRPLNQVRDSFDETVQEKAIDGASMSALVADFTGLDVQVKGKVASPNRWIDTAASVVRQAHFYSMYRFQIRSIIATNIRYDLAGNAFHDACDSSLERFLREKRYPSPGLKGFGMFTDSLEPLYAYYNLDGESSSSVASAGVDYEKLVLKALLDLGFDASLTSASCDGGVDVVAEIDGLRYAVQCKAHGKPVGIKGVQEVVAGRRLHRCDYSAVFSESGFTNAAYELARENQCALLAIGQASNLVRMF